MKDQMDHREKHWQTGRRDNGKKNQIGKRTITWRNKDDKGRKTD
jgi:hypothetical protein